MTGDGGEVVPFRRGTARPDEPAEVAPVEAELVDDVQTPDMLPATRPATAPARRQPIDLEVRRSPDYQRVTPRWMTDVVEARRASRFLVKFTSHRTAFHGLRLPLYTAKALAFSPVGFLRLAGALFRWVFDHEGAELRWHAVATKDPVTYLRLSKQRNDRVRRRLTVVALVGVLAAVVLGVLLVLSTLALALAAVAGVLTLGYAGRPKDRPFVGVASADRGPLKLTGEIVLRAFITAGLCKEDDPISFATPCHREGDRWRVVVDLPFGTAASKAVQRRAQIASGLDVLPGQLFLTPERGAQGSARRLEVWVAERDPTTVPAGPSPLLKAAKVNFWNPWPLGVDERGRRVDVCLLWLSMGVGGLPRMGKTFVMRLFALAAALDADVRIYMWDLKGSSDWAPFRHVAHELHQGEDVDPDTGVDPVARLLEVLHELRAEVSRRNRTLRTLPASEVPEGKLTERLARAKHMRMPLILLVIDEVHRAFEHPTYGKELAAELADLVRVAPSAGVMVLDGTQKPAGIGSGGVSESFKQFRDNHAARFGLRVSSWQVSDLVLGAGAYSDGLDCSMLPTAAKGAGIMRGTGDIEVNDGIVRTHIVDGSGAEQICQRARLLREQAGTLTGMAAGEQLVVEDAPPRRSVLADVIEALGADEQAHSDVLCARLAEQWPDLYGGLTPTGLGAQLRREGCPVKQLKAPSLEDGAVRNRWGVRRAWLYQAAGEPDDGSAPDEP